MKRIYKIWTAKGLPPCPEEQINRIKESVLPEYADLCQSFYLFRYLHRKADPDCTLLGDYCFGIFSAYLAELDSVPLNDAFSDWLSRDTKKPMDFPEYLRFIKENCGGER